MWIYILFNFIWKVVCDSFKLFYIQLCLIQYPNCMPHDDKKSRRWRLDCYDDDDDDNDNMEEDENFFIIIYVNIIDTRDGNVFEFEIELK